MLNQSDLKVLNDFFYNLNNPSAYSSPQRLFYHLTQNGHRIKKKDIIDWLRNQEAYALHKDRHLNFKRCSYNISNIDDLWEADLMDMQQISRINKGYKYILAVIDCFSKFGWCVAIKRKTPSEVINAFKQIFSKTERRPVCIQSDKGREFDNRALKAYLSEQDIKFRTTKDPSIKAAICERFIRTIKSIIFKYFTHINTNRYIDVLDSILHVYNNRKHSTIGTAPSMVNDENVLKIWKFMKEKNTPRRNHHITRCDVGDIVRVANPKKVFDKGYRQKWSKEKFRITKRIMRSPVVYQLCDMDNVRIDGNFYESEIQKIDV